jgi:uncharacterized membrane protein
MPRPSAPPNPSQAGTPDAVARNVRAVAELAKRAARQRSFVAQFCDRITYAAGTTWSLILHGTWFSSWIAVNALSRRPFDPFPFSLLTSLVSLEAIFLTLFVLSSQNRLTQDSDQRAQLDLQVNLLAEQEMTLVLRMLRDLCERADVAVPEGLGDVLCDVDIEQVAATVAEELSDEVTPPQPPNAREASRV